MGFSYVGGAYEFEATSDTTIATTDTIDVNDGDLIIAVAGWEDTDTNVASIAGGTNTLGPAAATWALSRTASGGNYIALGYKIGAANNNAEVFTLTLSVAAGYKGIGVMVFRPDAGDTVTLDAGPSGAGGYSNAPQSGNINTDGTALDNVIFGADKYYSYSAHSAEQIADGAATGVVEFTEGSQSEMTMWYRLFTTDPGDAIHAQGMLSYAPEWVCDILAFKSVAAGGPVQEVYMGPIRSAILV